MASSSSSSSSVQVWFRPRDAQSQGRRMVRLVQLDLVLQVVRVWRYFQEQDLRQSEVRNRFLFRHLP
jgi:hypothetical protein